MRPPEVSLSHRSSSPGLHCLFGTISFSQIMMKFTRTAPLGAQRNMGWIYFCGTRPAFCKAPRKTTLCRWKLSARPSPSCR